MTVAVQSLWVGGALSSLEQLSITSFLCHGHDYDLYTYEPVGSVPPGTVLRDAGEILPRSCVFEYPTGTHQGSVAGFADWFRYRLLAERGGWWVDTDVICLRPLPTVAPVVLASERVQAGGTLITPMLMKLPPGHPLIVSCCREAERIDKRTIEWSRIGPEMFHRKVRSLRMEGYVSAPGFFAPLDWWDVELLVRPNAFVPPLTAYTVHLWNERWRVAGMDKALSYPAESPYERLKTQYLR